MYWYITENHNGIKPALVLVFADYKHHKMPVRQYKWGEYLDILPNDKML